jgi:hypothetical protein
VLSAVFRSWLFKTQNGDPTPDRPLLSDPRLRKTL